jgi:hypothetical protein
MPFCNICNKDVQRLSRHKDSDHHKEKMANLVEAARDSCRKATRLHDALELLLKSSEILKDQSELRKELRELQEEVRELKRKSTEFNE